MQQLVDIFPLKSVPEKDRIFFEGYFNATALSDRVALEKYLKAASQGK